MWLHWRLSHVDPHSVDQRHYLMPTNESLENAAELFGDAIQRELDFLEEEDRKRKEAEERGGSGARRASR